MTWQRIKSMRTDMSDYVLHITRSTIETNAFDTLKKILTDGGLRATFAPRTSMRSQYTSLTVRGPYPAVCFTEQPLLFLTKSIEAHSRYTKFAIGVRKDELFQYGGRPAIYNDDSILGNMLTFSEKEQLGYPKEACVHKDGGLSPDLQYLWVGYDPTAIWDTSRAGAPIDWTHEREWRVRPNPKVNKSIGFDSKEFVPILLPSSQREMSEKPHFVILVDTEENKRDLVSRIENKRDELKACGRYWRLYASALFSARRQILSFEIIQSEKIDRIEDYFQLHRDSQLLYRKTKLPNKYKLIQIEQVVLSLLLDNESIPRIAHELGKNIPETLGLRKEVLRKTGVKTEQDLRNMI